MSDLIGGQITKIENINRELVIYVQCQDGTVKMLEIIGEFQTEITDIKP